MLHDISQKDIADVIAVVHPQELLAKKNKKTFAGKTYDAIVTLTTPKASDSPLRVTMKNHVKGALVTVRALNVFHKCKEIVTYVKKAGLNSKTLSMFGGCSLKQDVETRWMSNLGLLKSFFNTDTSV